MKKLAAIAVAGAISVAGLAATSAPAMAQQSSPNSLVQLVRHETPSYMSAYYTVQQDGQWKYTRHWDRQSGGLPTSRKSQRLHELIADPGLIAEGSQPKPVFCPSSMKRYSLRTASIKFSHACGKSNPRTPMFNEIVDLLEGLIPAQSQVQVAPY
ncbi:hypothetical protein OTB20_39325 [Streptomyces sp. H27-H1]|uniref:hypothetical protein n=1 Tax=Streptomyces sp. H27-H1 TaxID=2996461 RepID=UPI00226E5874|nr:hypothetical protein [Streptomyces sp. H27-H1]MCY0932123.1 hypothetical protein [Streptomyces sp. H27-H1]